MSDTLPGRELDMRVAEVVMGWRWWAFEKKEREGYGHPFVERLVRGFLPPSPKIIKSWEEWAKECGKIFRPATGEEPIERIQGTADLCSRTPVPEYSESWDGTGLVLDEMRRRGYLVVIEDWQERGWCVLFTFPNGHDTGQILGNTIGEAVCRAALLALESTR